jgi:catechol 2,3-dioxygenase-like lactoylglutathione lyase family enzyme
MRLAHALAAAFLFPIAAAAQTPALWLDGVAHVALRAGDLQASRAFYQKLGFEQSFEFSDAQGTTTSYMKVNDRQFIEIYRRSSAEEPLGLMHICFDTGGLDALCATYVARDLKPTDPRKARAGNLLFNLHDPEGQLLEYTQYLPGSMHFEDRGKHLGERRISAHMVRAATAVKDMQAQRAFYTGKLGFEEHGGNGRGRGGTRSRQSRVEAATDIRGPRCPQGRGGTAPARHRPQAGRRSECDCDRPRRHDAGVHGGTGCGISTPLNPESCGLRVGRTPIGVN